MIHAYLSLSIQFWHQILRLSDGGEVCLDWLDCEKDKNKNHPTVLFLPGLTGDAQSEYIKVSLIDALKHKIEIMGYLEIHAMSKIDMIFRVLLMLQDGQN